MVVSSLKWVPAGVVALGLGLTGAQALAVGQVVKVNVSETFVPVGFDDNDEVVAVLDGYLPNSCYKLEQADVKINQATRKVEVTQMAKRWPGPCLLVLVPFSSTVRLGILPQGEFTVAAMGAPEEKLSVREATTAGPDDHLYAPVDAATVVPATGAQGPMAILEGRFTNSCMRFDEIKVIDSGKSIEVLPIIKLEGTDPDHCSDFVEIPFRKQVPLPNGIAEGRHLLHVRSLNGRSVNTMFSISNDPNFARMID